MSTPGSTTVPCATERGYSRHRRRGEEPCAPCITAASNSRRDRRYGLAPGQWAGMFFAQGGRCKVCGAEPAQHPLVVDHDHKTGEVRGLICRFCNLTLGTALDSPDILRRAVLYLEGNLREAPDHFLGDLNMKGKRKPAGPLYKARAV